MIGTIMLALGKVPRWAWIAGGAAVLTLLLLWRAYAMGREAGVDSQQPEIASLTVDLQTALANEATLGKALNDQNVSIAALAKAGADAKAQALRAEKKAAEQRGRTEALQQRLEASSRQTGGISALPLTPDQKDAFDALR